MLGTEDIIATSSLIYSNLNGEGYYRIGVPSKFKYVTSQEEIIKDTRVLERISKLVIPPAWQNVWICKSPNGHIQVVGVDQKGRKQYVYHPEWVKRRANQKYFRLLEFGTALPKARKIVTNHLKRKKWDDRKVLAICFSVLQETLIRVGNTTYEKNYKSFGLSTLKDKHFKQDAYGAQLTFVGKKGVKQEIKLTNAKLVKLIKKSKDIPGQDLFQYYDHSGVRKKVSSTLINQYIKDITGDDFTAKDFRTWGATLEALRQFAICKRSNIDLDEKKIVLQTLDCVASKLGNTRSVCRKAYVYPMLINAFEEGKLNKYLSKMPSKVVNDKDLRKEETILINFLKDVKKAKVK